MYFEWDDDKAESNLKKHGVRFSEAVSIFMDTNALEILDSESSHCEDRWIRIGRSVKLRILVVIYCEREIPERIRIISARVATKNEEKEYSLRGFL